MAPESFSIKWFLVYYPMAGIVSMGTSLYFIFKPHSISSYLLEQARNQHPPLLFRYVLKYSLLFTIPGLGLSLYPFSWPEFIFSAWSLAAVFLAGSQLVRWGQLRSAITHGQKTLPALVRRSGVIMLSVALAICILEYLLIERAF